MINHNVLKSVFSGLIFLVLIGCSGSNSDQKQEAVIEMDAMEELILYVGTYTRKEAHVDGKAEGIYVYRMNPETGALTYSSTSTPVVNPSYIVVNPSRHYLYAVTETGGEGPEVSGAVSAFAIDTVTSALTLINQVSSEGDWPCYISIDYADKFAFVANYGGSIAMFPLAVDGSIEAATAVIEHKGQGPTTRQEGPHAHMIIPGFDNEQVYAVDLGADKVFVYAIDDEEQTLVPTELSVDLPAGAGPRHLALHPKQKTAYVINELNGTIEAFQIVDSGMLEKFQTISTLPDGMDVKADCADIQIHPNGNYLYASNRAEQNNIAIYAISPEDGSLKLLGHQSTFGKGPRSFVIDPSGSFLVVANQDSDNVFTFKIDESTGLLEDNPAETLIPTPVCLKFL